MSKEDKALEALLDQRSLYPELPRKSRNERKADLTTWLERYGEINASYNLYGLDVVGFRDPNDFLDNGVFKRQRYEVNSRFRPYGSDYPYDYSVVFRDKRLFDAFYSRTMAGLLPETLGYVVNGSLQVVGGISGVASRPLPPDDSEYVARVKAFCEANDGERIAVKQTFGCHGVNLKSCRIEGDTIVQQEAALPAIEFFRRIAPVGGGMWVVQRWLSQHPALAAFNESSVNTLRIVTYNTGGRVVATKASLLVGPEGSIVNNPEAGTETLFGINFDGRVSDLAYRFSACEKHPTRFVGTFIPYFKEALDVAKRAHDLLPEVFTVGWDVVITQNGPILLEGNDGWSPRAIQVPNQEGERGNWTRYLRERQAVYGRK